MRELCIDLDPETVDMLATEGAVAGFEDPTSYVRWLVEHRDGLDETPDRDHLLEAYRERFVELKREAADRDVDPDPAEDVAREPATEEADPEADETSPIAVAEGPRASSVDADAAALATATGPGVSRSAEPKVANTDGGRTMPIASADGSLELRGGPKTAVSRTAAPSVGSEPDEADHTQSTLEEADDVFGSVNLKPERVTRVEGDPVSEDATVLGAVETNRMDELSRRAVAKTRKTLNRDVKTGLEYTSSTTLADDVPLGEDVVDIASLEVPARSVDEERTRREVAGMAIAYLRDERRARKSDFVDALYEEYPAGYDSADSWWRCVKSALEQVDAIDGGRVWSFTA